MFYEALTRGRFVKVQLVPEMGKEGFFKWINNHCLNSLDFI